MKAKRTVALLLGAMSVASMAACNVGGGNAGGGAAGDSKVTTIQFMDYGGGVGNQWLYDAAARFEALKANESYEDGKMGVNKKYRGKFAAVLPQYIADRMSDPSDIYLDKVFVTHAGCDKEIIDACVNKVKSIAPEAEVMITRAGCTVSSHCGRNTLGVLFIRKTPLDAE